MSQPAGSLESEAVYVQAWRSRRMTRQGWRGAQSLHRGNLAWRRKRTMTMMWIWMRTGAWPQRMWVMRRKMMMT